MSGFGSVSRVGVAVGVVTAFVVAVPMVSTPSTPDERWTPMSPVAVSYDTARGGAVRGRLLSFNDFHGALEPPVGSGGLVNGTPAGGAEYLATHVKRLRAVGNHEFDEGVTGLQRLQRGGCHPTDGCQDGDGFAGADYRYLAANVVDKRSRLPILAPVEIRFVRGVPVAFVGMTLEGTPSIVNPAGIRGVEFLDEVTTANRYADLLRRFGIRSLVLLVHEGGQQNPPPTPQNPSDCANFAGPITNIVAGLRPEYGVVVSGHTHRFYSCALPNSSGADTVVTSAGSNGTLVTDIQFGLDRKSKRFTEVVARNVVVENGVRLPDGTWAKDPAGNLLRNPDLVDPDAKRLVDKYRTAVAPIADRVVGTITSDITRTQNAAGESALGDVIADAQRAYTPDAQLALTLTGAQLKEVLEQQFPGYEGQFAQRNLQVSAGFSYSYDTTRPLGDRVSAMTLAGAPIDPAASYRVTTNDFLAAGGDGFTRLTAGTSRITAPGFDIDALVAYLGTGTAVAPGPQDRIAIA